MNSPLRLLRQQILALEAPAHVGMLVPWANTVIEHELPHMADTALRWHYARLVPQSRSTALDDSFMDGLVNAIPAAADQLSALPLSAICFGCTSASATHRYGAASSGYAPNRSVPILSAFDAIVNTLADIDARNTALLTPYPHSITANEAAELAACGVTVTASHGMGETDHYDQIDPAETERAFIDLISDVGYDNVDAVVISCTNLHTLNLLPRLEREHGLPIVTSNVAMALGAARLAANAATRFARSYLGDADPLTPDDQRTAPATFSVSQR